MTAALCVVHSHASTVFFSEMPCCPCLCAGSGVAHAYGETQDEEGGGSAGSGARLRPCGGSLKPEEREGLCTAVYDFLRMYTLHCIFCKTETHLLTVRSYCLFYFFFFLSGNHVSLYIWSECC